MAILPFICQSVSGQTASAITLTLPSAPTPGNTLYLIMSGFAQSFTTPAGFGQVATYAGTYNQIWLFSKVATSSDAANFSYAFSGMTDIHMITVLEISGQPIVTPTYGSSSGSNPLTTGPLSAKSTADTLRILVYEWDQRGPVPSSLPANYYQMSDSSFMDPAVFSYHASVVYQIPPNSSGVQNLPMSGSCNYPVWMDLSFTAPGPQLIQNDQKIVQASTPATLTLPNSVAPGNFLLLLAYGPDANYQPPPGFTVPISAGSGTSVVSYCYKTATASDGNSFTFSANTGGVYDFQLMEIAGGAPPASVAKGVCTISGPKITTGPTVNSNDASSLIILLVGWRERDLTPATPKAFYDADYARDYFWSTHWAPQNACNVYVTPSIWGGQAQSVTLNGNPSTASYMALQITSKNSRANRASVVWMF